VKTEFIETHEENGIVILTFNRPKALNALNSQLLRELDQVLTEIEINEDNRVLVVTGAGDKAFIAGADIAEIRQLSPIGAKKFSALGQRVIDRLHQLPIPVIAAVNGFALGGGCETALACDFIYASQSATFGLPEINLGIIPGFGGTQRLSRLIGASLARELIFTGRFISAEEGLRIGLVNRVVPADQLLDEALKTAKTITEKGKASLMLAKETVRLGLNTDLNTGLELERDAFGLCLTSPDAQEGTGAFLEKRKPKFTGKRDI
jgi:enoyl-CoA hydratase